MSLSQRSSFTPATAVLAFVLTVSAQAVTIHVPGDEPTIGDGIGAASAGDTVLVACGTYYERDVTMKSGVYLTSETGLADCVTIDAQQQGRVFYCYGVDATASIMGFTITGGLGIVSGGGMYCGYSSPALTGCTFLGNQAHDSGGGMYCYSSSPTLTGCTFVWNQACDGGGMYCSSSSPTLTDCTFKGNQATSDYGGGGMRCYSSSPTLTGCTFVGNQAFYGGGGMYCSSSSPTLTDCTFKGNQATSDYGGGGMLCYSSSPTLTGCTFSGNHAFYGGGGMNCDWHSSPTLMACTFVGNQAWDGGGMFCSRSSPPTLTDCIIAFSQLGEAVYCGDANSVPVLICCDVYGNAGGDWTGCIANQYGINGNISEDPLFCDALGGDFTLHEDSPCAAYSWPNPECELIGAWPVGCGPTTAVEEPTAHLTSWGSIKAMFR